MPVKENTKDQQGATRDFLFGAQAIADEMTRSVPQQYRYQISAPLSFGDTIVRYNQRVEEGASPEQAAAESVVKEGAHATTFVSPKLGQLFSALPNYMAREERCRAGGDSSLVCRVSATIGSGTEILSDRAGDILISAAAIEMGLSGGLLTPLVAGQVVAGTGAKYFAADIGDSTTKALIPLMRFAEGEGGELVDKVSDFLKENIVDNLRGFVAEARADEVDDFDEYWESNGIRFAQQLGVETYEDVCLTYHLGRDLFKQNFEFNDGSFRFAGAYSASASSSSPRDLQTALRDFKRKNNFQTSVAVYSDEAPTLSDTAVKLLQRQFGQPQGQLRDRLTEVSQRMNVPSANFAGLKSDVRRTVNQHLAHFFHRSSQLSSQEMIASAKSMYGVIGKIGEQIDSRGLQRVAGVGQQLVNFHQVLGKLNINLPMLGSFTQLSSFLNPAVGAISAGIALFSAFGFGRRKKSSASGGADTQLVKAIQALHSEMRQSFGQVFQNQQRLFESVMQLGEFTQNGFIQVGRQLERIMRQNEQLLGAVDRNYDATISQSVRGQEERLTELDHQADAFLGFDHESRQRDELMLDILQRIERRCNFYAAHNDFKSIQWKSNTPFNGWFHLDHLQVLVNRKEFLDFQFKFFDIANVFLWQRVLNCYFEIHSYATASEDEGVVKQHYRVLQMIMKTGEATKHFVDTVMKFDFFKAFFAYYQSKLDAIKTDAEGLLKLIEDFYSEAAMTTRAEACVAMNAASPDKGRLAEPFKANSSFNDLDALKDLLTKKIRNYNELVKELQQNQAILLSLLHLDVDAVSGNALVTKTRGLREIREELYDSLAQVEKSTHGLGFFCITGSVENPFRSFTVSDEEVLAFDDLFVESVVDMNQYVEGVVSAALMYQELLQQQFPEHVAVVEDHAASFDVQKLVELRGSLQPVFDIAQPAKGQALAMVVGVTGSGKSTLVNYEHGCDYEDATDDDGFPVAKLSEGSEKEVCKVGEDPIDSETQLPQVVSVLDEKVVFCDMPGFGDSRGEVVQMRSDMSLEVMAKSAEKLSGLVWVIEYGSLASRGVIGEFKKTLSSFVAISKGNFKLMSDSLVVAISKADSTTSSEAVIARLSRLAKARSLGDDEGQLLLEIIARLREHPERLYLSDVFDSAKRGELTGVVSALPGINADELNFVSFSDVQAHYRKDVLAFARQYNDSVGRTETAKAEKLGAYQEVLEKIIRAKAQISALTDPHSDLNYVAFERIKFNYSKQTIDEQRATGVVTDSKTSCRNLESFRATAIAAGYTEQSPVWGGQKNYFHHYFKRVRLSENTLTRTLYYLNTDIPMKAQMFVRDQSAGITIVREYSTTSVWAMEFSFPAGVDVNHTFELLSHKQFVDRDVAAEIEALEGQLLKYAHECLRLQDDIRTLDENLRRTIVGQHQALSLLVDMSKIFGLSDEDDIQKFVSHFTTYFSGVYSGGTSFSVPDFSFSGGKKQGATGVSNPSLIIGPSTVEGWAIHHVLGDGNCFYRALAHQLELIGHPLFDELLRDHSAEERQQKLRQRLDPRSQNTKWVDSEYDFPGILNLLDIIIAVVDTRYPERAFQCYYLDDSNKFCTASDDAGLTLPDKPVVRITFTGNHYESVTSHPALAEGPICEAYEALPLPEILAEHAGAAAAGSDSLPKPKSAGQAKALGNLGQFKQPSRKAGAAEPSPEDPSPKGIRRGPKH